MGNRLFSSSSDGYVNYYHWVLYHGNPDSGVMKRAVESMNQGGLDSLMRRKDICQADLYGTFQLRKSQVE